MREYTVITGNAGKARELGEMLGISVTSRKVDLPEIQSLDVADVAARKARGAFAVVGTPVIVDDTGLSIDGWNGLPGALVAWFLDSVGTAGILHMAEGLTDRSASVETALGFCDESGVRVFVGRVSGFLADSPRGTNGFGYDEIFVPSGFSKTLAELDAGEKNEISMRRLAADQLRGYLDSRGQD